MLGSRFAFALAVLAALACGACSPSPESSSERAGGRGSHGRQDEITSNSPVKRACALPAEHLLRINRGYAPQHSEDVHVVPRLPAFFGSMTGVNHSGPWKHLQQVPLVLYGPRRIAAAGVVRRPVTIADVYPTMGRLTGIELKPRAGSVLTEALKAAPGRPRLIVTIVWDGVGRNVLNHWPGKWPTLARLERTGTSYVNATVGSSPSITPATHATLGTGAFPRKHTVTGIYMRDGDGLKVAFDGTDPTDLPLSTYADQIDEALGNEPEVGILAWGDWHMAMMGHGRALPRGDVDDLAIILHGGAVDSNPDFFSAPRYLDQYPGLQTRVDELDRADGKADGLWLGHDILADMRNPAWVEYAADMLLGLIQREGYGADGVTDLMFVNFKMTDYIGHKNQYESKEMAGALKAQDHALERLIDYLDSRVGDYVVVLTADHGHTPSPRHSGGWPISYKELKRDINTHFGVPKGESIVQRITAVGIFVDHKTMSELGVTGGDIARFVNDYTIGQSNVESKLPAAFRRRADGKLFAAAWPMRKLDDVMRCKFGEASQV